VIRRIWALALNTFREAIRKRLLYGLLIMVALVQLFALVLGEMSLHEEARVARDVGLFCVSFFGSITAIILGVLLLYGEIQRKTIHTILSKPIERYEFVLGKYLGMAVTLTVIAAAFVVSMTIMLSIAGVPFDGAIARAALLAWMEILVVAAVAVFFSSFSTPVLSGIFTAAIWLTGRVTPELRYAVQSSKTPWIKETARAALNVVPDFNVFAVSGSQVDGAHVSVNGTFVTWPYVGTTAAYAGAVIAILLIIAALIFRRRDFA
jgi:ABC-type transport system involved in multi-copper enzyme maturation permease subunit